MGQPTCCNFSATASSSSVQIKRSIIVRIDQISSKSKDSITVADKEVKIGVTYMSDFKKLPF